MSDLLLPYYHQELAFIRRLGAEFARDYPKIAGRLQLGPEGAEDPHVERLIEAFAYLNARIRRKLDDDFPELSDALLEVLYPHYLRPVPSMAIVQMELDRGQAELVGGYSVAQGSTIETEPIDGEPCRFRTGYPVTLWPIEIKAARLAGRPFAAPAASYSAKAVAVLHLELQCLAPEVTFAQLRMDHLRFFLRGQTQHVYALYEALLNQSLGIALARSPRDPQPTLLPADALRPVGFQRDEGLLPFGPQSLLGYRLLTEYFAFPEKFLFVDLTRLSTGALSNLGRELHLFVYLNATNRELEQNVDQETFVLGCTPIVNLYSQRAEPIALTHTQPSYRVVPDVRRPQANEIYSIDRVTATSPDNEQVEYNPFYCFKHAAQREQVVRFYHATRRAEHSGGPTDRGTDVYLSLVDLDFAVSAPADWTLEVQTTCLNRDLCNRLPFGPGQPELRLAQGGQVAKLTCLTRPTPTLRSPLGHGARWRLISHLSLSHLSLTDTEADGAEALREILRLYDFRDSDDTRRLIRAVLNIRSRRVVGRPRHDPQGSFCRGVEVTVHLDEEGFSGSGVYLFASVLDRFLGLYCSVNSFSRLIATSNKRETEVGRWPPRSGEMVLL